MLLMAKRSHTADDQTNVVILLMAKHSHIADGQTNVHLQTKNRKPEANWGSSVDAFTFNSALSSIQVRRDNCFQCFITNFDPFFVFIL